MSFTIKTFSLAVLIYMITLCFSYISPNADTLSSEDNENIQDEAMALNVYVIAGAKQFTFEFGRFPEDLSELKTAGLLLQEPWNYIAGREIPLDGSLREDGDLWLEQTGQNGLEVVLLMPEKPIRTVFSTLPKPRLVSPRSDFLDNPLAANVKAYYGDPTHRKLFYMMSIVSESYLSLGADNVDTYRNSAYFPNLSYAINPITGLQLKMEASPGNFTLQEKEEKAYLAWYDQEGLVIPDPHVILGTAEDYHAGKPGKLSRMPCLLCRGR